MDLSRRDVSRVVRKWLPLLIIIPLLVGGLVAAYNYAVLPDVYTAKISLYLLARYEDAGGVTRYDPATGNLFSGGYQALFDRSPVGRETAEWLDISSIEAVATLRVQDVPEASIVELSVTGTDGDLCLRIADTAAEKFKGYLEGILQTGEIAISQDAEASLARVGPARLQNTVLSFLMALVACLLFMAFREAGGGRVVSGEWLEDVLETSLLGEVADYRRQLRQFLEKETGDISNFYEYIPSVIRESVRVAAANIGFAGGEHPPRTIALTAPSLEEEKSALLLLLAAAYGETGKRVLAVDLDFQRPTLGRVLKRRNAMDLSDYLRGGASFQDIISPAPQRNVFFIDSRHPFELLSEVAQSDTFLRFLVKAREEFDLILFDTPPLGLYIDAAILAPRVDGVVVAVSSGVTEKEAARATLEQLGRSGAAVLGAVMNDQRVFNPQGTERGYTLYAETTVQEAAARDKLGHENI